MELNTIIKALRSEIKYEKEAGNNLEHINWGNQEGILVSVNDLEKLLDACGGKNVDASENTLPIQRVSNNEERVAVCPRCKSNKIEESEEHHSFMDCNYCGLTWAN